MEQRQTIEKDVRVVELQVGDILLPTMCIVTHAPYDDIKTPKGKINLGVRRPGQEEGYRKTWGKSTTIKIRRQI